jgi:hypothetical protein
MAWRSSLTIGKPGTVQDHNDEIPQLRAFGLDGSRRRSIGR